MEEYDEYEGAEPEVEEEQVDEREEKAVEVLTEFFEKNKKRVFYFRQIEVYHEGQFFHWITNRALHRLIGKVLRVEERKLKFGSPISFIWHKSLRYYKTEIKKTLKLVEEYSDPYVGASLGLNGEFMVLEGFARKQFLCVGRHTNSYGGKKWMSDHNLDFIFEKDSIAYGVEVKNQLRYPEHSEINNKMQMCEYLGVRPVFVARMMPKSWINEVRKKNGFSLILKYQLYPLSHKVVASRVAKELGLPVDTPKFLMEKTMKRFLGWHERNCESGKNSQRESRKSR